MRQDEYPYSPAFYAPATRSQSSSPPPFFPEPNVPGEGPSSDARYGVPRGGAIYSSATNGVSHEDVYPQLPTRSSPHPLGIGYGVYSKQPPIPRSPSPTVHQPYPVRGPAYAAHTPHLSNVLHQQNPAYVIATSSHYHQGSAVQDASGRLHHQQWTSNYPVFSPPAGSFLQLPDQPQDFNLTNEHHLSYGPLMPVAQPYYRRTGKRRALIIGINYSSHSDPAFHLRHAVDDAYGMANFLFAYLGFAPDDIRIMTDECSPWNLPTKENILRELASLVYDAQPNDSLFFYYSGHAMQIEDISGDESDGFDECICAMDYLADDPFPNPDTPGIIVDDIMHDIMVKPLPLQCRLTAIFDSCHSGTLLDLPHIYDSSGVVKEFLHPHRLAVLREKSSNAHVVSLSASRDYEEALETRLGGVLRAAFMDCLHVFRYKVTYKQLIWHVREYMKFNGFPQRPQLSSSYEIDTNRWFDI